MADEWYPSGSFQVKNPIYIGRSDNSDVIVPPAETNPDVISELGFSEKRTYRLETENRETIYFKYGDISHRELPHFGGDGRIVCEVIKITTYDDEKNKFVDYTIYLTKDNIEKIKLINEKNKVITELTELAPIYLADLELPPDMIPVTAKNIPEKKPDKQRLARLKSKVK